MSACRSQFLLQVSAYSTSRLLLLQGGAAVLKLLRSLWDEDDECGKCVSVVFALVVSLVGGGGGGGGGRRVQMTD